ncbi:MAG: class I SAM-dependent methyltransferase [Butyrivibrio sp.]|nr:class I SAM-dependent methyltransferase [Butyrivibrio sp.]
MKKYLKYGTSTPQNVLKKINLENLIDIGCGPGAFLSEVSRLFPEVQLNALDLSEEMIEETKSRGREDV